jgi:hypothetical protein
MTRDSDFIGIIEEYLDEHEGHTPLPDGTRNAIRAELPSTRQHPAWWPRWRFPESTRSEPRSMASGETNRIQIIDVDGVRLVLVLVEYAHTTDVEEALGMDPEADAHVSDQPELRRILDSIRIECQP